MALDLGLRLSWMGLEPLSEAPLSALQPPAPSFLVVLAEAACLRKLLDLSIVLPWLWIRFSVHLAALPHVRRLSFVLGNIPFWFGFGRCLIFLFAPYGCRRAYCGPHCGCEASRVLVSHFGSSPSGGPTPVSCLFLSLRPCRSLSIPFALSPLSRHVFVGGVRPLLAVALAEGRLPIRWAPSEPMGLAVAPPTSPSTGPGQSPHLAVRPLEFRSVFHKFPARRSASIHGDNICHFHWLMHVPTWTFP